MFENRQVNFKFDEQPVVYMLVGLPGSGKSTFRDNKNLPFTSADWYIEKWAAEQKTTYNNIWKDFVDVATDMVRLDIEWFNSCSSSWIWDQTNLTPKVRKKNMNKIDDKFRKIAVFFDISLEECLARNEKRDRTIPADVIVKMHGSLVKPTLEEGFDQIWIIDESGELQQMEERIVDKDV